MTGESFAKRPSASRDSLKERAPSLLADGVQVQEEEEGVHNNVATRSSDARLRWLPSGESKSGASGRPPPPSTRTSSTTAMVASRRRDGATGEGHGGALYDSRRRQRALHAARKYTCDGMRRTDTRPPTTMRFRAASPVRHRRVSFWAALRMPRGGLSFFYRERGEAPRNVRRVDRRFPCFPPRPSLDQRVLHASRLAYAAVESSSSQAYSGEIYVESCPHGWWCVEQRIPRLAPSRQDVRTSDGAGEKSTLHCEGTPLGRERKGGKMEVIVVRRSPRVPPRSLCPGSSFF